jgi:hypothetical protein
MDLPFDEWVRAIFDPDIEDPYPDAAVSVAHLTRFFDDPAAAVRGFTDDEIGAGLWSIADAGGAGSVLALNQPAVPLPERVACVRLFTNVYREIFAVRAAPRLGHLSEEAGRLELACYMWWDIAAFGGAAGTRDGNLLEDAVLDVLDDVLRIPHAACQESAIHGLGHRVARHPERAPDVLDRWLRRGPIADDRLVPYANAARAGCIQ